MPSTDHSLLPLLHSLAAATSGLGGARFDDEQVEFLRRSGLGPLLHHVVENDDAGVPETSRALVVGAEIAGKAAHERLRAALCEILDAARDITGTIALLKGMSLCRYYPRPHLRPMGDIDLLVVPDALPDLEGVLGRLGYRPGEFAAFGFDQGFYDRHHHIRPFVHPQTGVCVEAHRALFPPHCRIPTGSPLAIDSARAQLVASTFEGREVCRFGAEMELLYAAAHWAFDMHLPVVACGMLDALCLLRSTGDGFDWDLLGSWLTVRETATPVDVLFTYLRRHGLVELGAATTKRLDRAPKSVGRLGRRVLHRILDRCMQGRLPRRSDRNYATEIVWRTLFLPRPALVNVCAVPYNVAFPPHHPDRFRPLFHLRRLRSLVSPHAPGQVDEHRGDGGP